MSDQRIAIASILCPTDFSEAAESALARASSITRAFHPRLTLLHVLPLETPADPAGEVWRDGSASGQPSQVKGLGKARAQLRKSAERLAAAGLRVESRIACGEVWRETASAAADVEADLVVLGTRGGERWDRVVMGSTAHRLAGSLECPVLVVHEDNRVAHGRAVKRILCPLDLTYHSSANLDLALALAAANLAELTLLHVHPEAPADRAHAPQGATLPVTESDLDHARHRLRAFAEQDEVTCRTVLRVTSGTASEKITSIAAEIGADLIVMGARGDAELRTVGLGSTTEAVIRHASCPILLVKPFGYRKRANETPSGEKVA